MKFALIFLMAFVALSQQFYLQRPNVPLLWLAPHPALYVFNNDRPLVIFNEDPNQHEDLNQHVDDDQNSTNGEQDVYTDVQSRRKNSRPSVTMNEQQSGRFLAGSFGNGNINGFNYNGNQIGNPFLRTYTTTTTSTSTTISLSTSTSTSTSITSTTSTSTAVITATATLSLTSVVRCVPALQLSPVPVSCRRKKREIGDEDSEAEPQFIISPSETLGLVPTALPSTELSFPVDHLSSSKDDQVNNVQVSNEDLKREKRFFLLNRNYYTTSTVTATSTSVIVIPTTTVSPSTSTLTAFATTTSTTFVFSNSTITQTVNLINPAPVVQCLAAAAAAGQVVCVSCLPAGYVVCAAAG